MKKKGGGLMGIESDEGMVIKTLFNIKNWPFCKEEIFGFPSSEFLGNLNWKIIVLFYI